MSGIFWIVVAIFLVTYAGMAVGKIPGLGLDRAGIALVGAVLILLTGGLSLNQAVSRASIDYKTLLLLFGLMIVVGFLRLSGFFQRLTILALKRIRGPKSLLAVTIILAGGLSAFLINDVVCVAMTPLVIHLTRRLRYDPVPFLIALATAANIGSASTITGNPQNIYIGSHSGISDVRFAMRLFPVAALGLLLNYVLVHCVYRSRLRAVPGTAAFGMDKPVIEEAPPEAASSWLRWKSVVVTLATIVLFFTGWPLEYIALGAAAVLLVGRVKTHRAFGQVDWGLLVMFSGLFVVVHAFQIHVVNRWGIQHWHWLLDHPVGLLSGVALVLSNVVSNVPAVLLLEPILEAIHGAAARENGWLALAMSSTFAGNLTVLGSVANLIVVESAAREGVRVSLWEYCKVGIPLTLLTIGIGVVWLNYMVY